MARPRYTISGSDRSFAWRWIDKKLSNPLWLGETRTYAAYQNFSQINENDVDSLNRWCETWLGSSEWTQLKNAVRAARKRRDGNGVKNVTLSRYAWSILDFWARRDGCTFSEVIEKRLGGKGSGMTPEP